MVASKNISIIGIPDAIGSILRGVLADIHPYNWWHEVMANVITHHLADKYDIGCFARDLDAVQRVPKRTTVLKHTMKRHGLHPFYVEKALAHFKEPSSSLEIEPIVKQEPMEESPAMDTRLPYLDPKEWRRGKTEAGNEWRAKVTNGRLRIGGLLTEHEIQEIQANIDIAYDRTERVQVYQKTIQHFHSMMSHIRSIAEEYEAHRSPKMIIRLNKTFRGQLYDLDYGLAVIVLVRGTVCISGHLRAERDTLTNRFTREGKEYVFHGGRLMDFMNMLQDTLRADKNAVTRLLGLGVNARLVNRALHLARIARNHHVLQLERVVGSKTCMYEQRNLTCLS